MLANSENTLLAVVFLGMCIITLLHLVFDMQLCDCVMYITLIVQRKKWPLPFNSGMFYRFPTLYYIC